MSNRLLIAWPGAMAPQQGMWSFLTAIGQVHERTDHCQQFDSYGKSISTEAAYARVRRRDWHPNDPTHGYWDHEPPNWIWTTWRDGTPQSEADLMAADRAILRERMETEGISQQLGIYGFPVIGRDPPRGWQLADKGRWDANAKMVSGWDWVMVNLYPPERGPHQDWMRDEESHALRAATHYKVATELYGVEAIPFLYLDPWRGLDTERYAAVYVDALLAAGCKRLGIWMDLRDLNHLTRAIRAVNPALPHLRRFVGVM